MEEQINTRSRISQLSPFLDAAGLIRVGSRAAKSSVFTSEETHPRIISKASWLANLIISHHHSKVHHQGRIFTQASLQQSGFWIVGAHCLTKSLIRKCVTCKKLQKTPIAQQMGLLPKIECISLPQLPISVLTHLDTSQSRRGGRRLRDGVLCSHACSPEQYTSK